jgi:hypothetical protein
MNFPISWVSIQEFKRFLRSLGFTGIIGNEIPDFFKEVWDLQK